MSGVDYDAGVMVFVGRFFLVVLVMGFVELYLLVGASRAIGFFTTLGLCVLTGVVGGSLVRHQGLRTMQEVNQSMAGGELPARAIVSGVVLMIVGVLLIMPGFVTDVIGFLLLIPPVRLGAAALLVRSFERRMQRMQAQGGQNPFGPFAGGDPFAASGTGGPDRRPVIEAEAEVVRDDEQR